MSFNGPVHQLKVLPANVANHIENRSSDWLHIIGNINWLEKDLNSLPVLQVQLNHPFDALKHDPPF